MIIKFKSLFVKYIVTLYFTFLKKTL